MKEATMELKQVRCTNCGYPAKLNLSQPHHTCEACGSAFLLVHAHQLQGRSEAEVETVKNNRQNLNRALISNDLNAILHHTQNILNILPEDFKGLYYNAYASSRLTHPQALQSFLKEKAYDATPEDLEEVADHITKYIDLRERSLVIQFIERFVPEKMEAVKAGLERRIEKENDYAAVKRDVFICHRSTEKDIALDVLSVLEKDGHTAWISHRNLRPDDNENYWKNIRLAIKNCEVFLVISSIDAMLSPDIQEEVNIALEMNKKRLEYKMDDALHTTQFKQFFSGVKWIDAIKTHNFEELKERVYDLKRSTPSPFRSRDASSSDENPFKKLFQTAQTHPSSRETSSSLSSLIKRAYFELDLENYDSVLDLVEQILNQDIESIDGWVIKFLGTYHYTSVDTFEKKIAGIPLGTLQSYQQDVSYKALHKIDNNHSIIVEINKSIKKLIDISTQEAVEKEAALSLKAKNYNIAKKLNEDYNMIYAGALHSAAITPDGRLFIWGSNENGELGNGSHVDSNVPKEITQKFDLAESDQIISVALSKTPSTREYAGDGLHSLALSKNGRIFAWGHNGYDQLGTGTDKSSPQPIEITEKFNLLANEMIRLISVGGKQSLAITTKNRVFMWGGDELEGNCSKDLYSGPIEVTDEFNLVEDENILSAHLAVYHSSALSSKGRVFLWGSNENCQLGDDSQTASPKPKDITPHFNLELGEVVVTLTLSDSISSAITSHGRLFIWGLCDADNKPCIFLNKESEEYRDSGVPIDITPHFKLENNERITSISISSSDYNTVDFGVITSQDRLFMWGHADSLYKTYSNSFNHQDYPSQVNDFLNLNNKEKIMSIDFGKDHVIVLTSEGRVLTWGSNLYGQLGDGSNEDCSIPIDITSLIVNDNNLKTTKQSKINELPPYKGEEDVKSQFKYEINNQEVTIKKYLGNAKEVVILEKIEGYPVTEIGATAFMKKQLTNVSLPDSVIIIGNGAFAYNQLARVTIPNSVITIGKQAFKNNQLTSFTIGNNVISIGSFAFSTNQLTSITIPESVKSIDNWAFWGNQLTSITIPDNVRIIAAGAFYSNQLTNIIIPKNATIIGAKAFAKNQLKNLIIPESVTTIDDWAFWGNQLTSVKLLEGITRIGAGAFRSNQLTSVTIPNSVTRIGEDAFSYNQLTSVTIPESVLSIADWAFEFNELTSIVIEGDESRFNDKWEDMGFPTNLKPEE